MHQLQQLLRSLLVIWIAQEVEPLVQKVPFTSQKQVAEEIKLVFPLLACLMKDYFMVKRVPLPAFKMVNRSGFILRRMVIGSLLLMNSSLQQA